MKEIDEILDPILMTFRDRLSTTLQGHSAMAYLRGSAEMIEWGRTKLSDRPIFYEGAPIQQAIDYANKHSAQLVTRMDEETKSRLAKVIGDAIENKRGIPGLARDIRREFDDMTKFRSQLIARTETADSLSEAFMDRSKAMGVTGKEVVTAPEGDYPCEICQANADEGVVPIDHIFSSGHTSPPFHPACLLPDVRVEAPLTISGSRAFYNGDAIELTTEDGNRLPITPNHPILTPMGFIKAKALREGDYVIDCLDSKRVVFSIDPYYDQSPAFIEDIWDSLVMKDSEAKNLREVSSDSFHGDGSKLSNIQVVFARSDSYCNYKPDGIIEHYLVDGYRLNSLELYGLRTFPLKEQGYGRVGKCLCPVDISQTNQQFQQKDRGYLPSWHGKIQESLTSVCDRSCFVFSDYEQYRNDGGGVLLDSVLFGGVSDSGHSESLIIPDDVQRSLVGAGVHNKHRIDTTLDIWHQGGYKQCKLPYNHYTTANWQSQEKIEERRGYPKLAKGFLERYGGLVAPKQIIKVRNFNYSGHVFDLQSLEQLYIANNIIVKNCRCALAPVML